MSDLPGFLDFTKPGHFVDDNNFPPFIRFWKRYGRNFLKLIQLNLLYAVAAMPVYVWLTTLINVSSTQAGGGVMTVLGSMLLSIAINLPVPLLVALLVLSVLLLGPTTAAMSYSALNFAWDRPGLFWPNFREAWKTNWKQALPFGITDVLVCFVTLYYLADGTADFGNYGSVLKVLWIVLALVYAMIRVYLYPIMVTIELPTGALIKNCLILSLLKIWRPLVVVLIALVLAALCMVADIVIVPCFLYSFVAYTAAFLTEPVIRQYLINIDETSDDNTEE